MPSSVCNRLLLPALIALVPLQGCALISSGNLTAAEKARRAAIESSITHVVKRGDMLSNIAVDYTGDFNNWQQIAAFNEIEDARLLRIGDTLLIPAHLLKDENPDDAATDARPDEAIDGDERKQAAGREVADASQTLPSEPASGGTATRSSLALERVASAGQTRARIVPSSRVKLEPVDANRDFTLQPLAAHTNSDPGTRRVKVLGSYYPVAVYAEPATWSRLVKRVAPGTEFEIEEVDDDWYTVTTDEGIAFLRRDDGELIE